MCGGRRGHILAFVHASTEIGAIFVAPVCAKPDDGTSNGFDGPTRMRPVPKQRSSRSSATGDATSIGLVCARFLGVVLRSELLR